MNESLKNQFISSGVFSTGAMGAMAPVILRKRLIAPAVSTRNGKILLTLGTRNIKILNTPMDSICEKFKFKLNLPPFSLASFESKIHLRVL